MNEALFKTIEASKKYLKSAYFQIIGQADGSFVIKQYTGPIKSTDEMMAAGYNRHLYLTSFICEEYSQFNINDFYSEDGITIRKKEASKKLEEKIQTAATYFSMNADLLNAVKTFKELLKGIMEVSYSQITFTEFTKKFNTTISSSSLDELTKLKYIVNYDHLINEIYSQLEICGIEKPRKFFNEQFNDFLILIK